MRRTIAKWLISRSLDGDGPLPVWLQRWVDRDEELLRFEAAARQVGEQLRSEAPAWMAQQAEMFQRSQRPRHAPASAGRTTRRWNIAWPLATCAAAVGICLMLADWRATDRPTAASIANDFWSSDAWQAGRASVVQWQTQLAKASDRWEEVAWRGASTILHPAEAAGATASQALVRLNDGIESQREELSSDMRSAAAFFAFQLPASTAKLMGLTSLQAFAAGQEL